MYIKQHALTRKIVSSKDYYCCGGRASNTKLGTEASSFKKLGALASTFLGDKRMDSSVFLHMLGLFVHFLPCRPLDGDAVVSADK